MFGTGAFKHWRPQGQNWEQTFFTKFHNVVDFRCRDLQTWVIAEPISDIVFHSIVSVRHRGLQTRVIASSGCFAIVKVIGLVYVHSRRYGGMLVESIVIVESTLRSSIL